ncbi:hypothetical protein QUB80_10655 [Chlorogloeopsis sp. ULAP01]|nr:hypothetical protein [Chlorogloeopsis sp. ULAP01]
MLGKEEFIRREQKYRAVDVVGAKDIILANTHTARRQTFCGCDRDD